MGDDSAMVGAGECAHYPHNSPKEPVEGNSAYSAHSFERADLLMDELRAVGVVLSVDGERLAFDAPAELLTEELLGMMRANREGLLACLMAESVPTVSTSVVCPWCRSADLVDDAEVIRCGRCRRVAWLVYGESIVRADWVERYLEN